MATWCSSLHFTPRWIHVNLRSLSTAESKPWWGNYSCGLSRRWQLIGKRLYSNIRSLCTVSWLQDRRAESHRSHRLHSSHVAANLHLWWVKNFNYFNFICSHEFFTMRALLPDFWRSPGSSNFLKTMFSWFRSVTNDDKDKQRIAKNSFWDSSFWKSTKFDDIRKTFVIANRKNVNITGMVFVCFDKC